MTKTQKSVTLELEGAIVNKKQKSVNKLKKRYADIETRCESWPHRGNA